MAGRKPASQPEPQEPVEVPVEETPVESPVVPQTDIITDADTPAGVDLLDPNAPDPVDDRAAALAALAAGETPVEVPVEETPVDVADLAGLKPTGKTFEWGGQEEYMVITDLFFAEDGPKTVMARLGDVVKPNDYYADRGLRLNALVKL